MNGTVVVIGIVGLVLIVIAVLAIISFYFYNLAIKRGSKDFLSSSGDLVQNAGSGEAESAIDLGLKDEEAPAALELDGVQWVDSQVPDIWHITTQDGLKLQGYFLPAKSATANTVILAHGYSSKGKDLGLIARFYYEQFGYNVLMPDDRGHGASEGNYIGFGWADRFDYLQWIRKTVDMVGEKAKIVLHGISMGGATVMMVSGEPLPPQVKAIVEDCGYTSVRDQLAYQLKRLYKLPAFPILHATSLLTKLRAGYSFDEASALRQLERNKLPMLFIHGGSDTFVPTEMVYRLYEACQTKKELYVADGAGHGLAYSTNKAAYERKVHDFIARYVV
ncbi:alpha/beta hydrolase [Paenibacillus harenae]|uniref:alpha/beta hydrolase n=1 Tax=Paenibacillus harenae TaxID=306543 RepID=UPI00278F7CC2|nr:alpha/beta hydrolase [Paenibacillus harenae]MDQ0058499.1 fermentation-respiration switch protein FrsA (DUF1100 family) [Paenibacillus harenae]